jgi:DNA-binding CsgD family transcriptional regulator
MGAERADAKNRSIVGVWMMESETAPDGRETHSIYTQYTRCKIYDADSTYYTVQLHAVGNEMLIIAHEMGRYRLNDSLYMERDRVMPFEWVDDTTFITTFEGYRERMVRSTTMTEERMERKLAEIEEERTLRPELVSDAMKQVESEFFQSDYYMDLRRRIEAGTTIKPAEWKDLEQRLKVIYPHFSSSLYGLYNLSPTEYQVCLLIKIHTTPIEIASVLCKDKSTISSIRKRLYKKVFDKEGSGKDWDELILSL